MRFHLAVFDDTLRSFPIDEGTLIIGRSKRNHVRVFDHLLSRKHCSLTLAGDQLTLVDLNSSNGTYVNGVRIGTRGLQKDDIIELGKTVMVVFDGEGWSRGEGLLNLRHPVKAQELVQLLNGQSPKVEPRGAPRPGAPKNGVRPTKGLNESERSFLRWLEHAENRILPRLVTDYLTHKLVSLLVRNSLGVRSAFTSVLEQMMRPEFFQRLESIDDLRENIENLVARELEDLRTEPEAPEGDRGLLEPEVDVTSPDRGRSAPAEAEGAATADPAGDAPTEPPTPRPRAAGGERGGASSSDRG